MGASIFSAGATEVAIFVMFSKGLGGAFDGEIESAACFSIKLLRGIGAKIRHLLNIPTSTIFFVRRKGHFCRRASPQVGILRRARADETGTGAQKRRELCIFAVDETSSRRVTQHLRANSTPKRFHT
jgi:hypothetical protein